MGRLALAPVSFFARCTRTSGTHFWVALIPTTVAVAPQSWVGDIRVPPAHCCSGWVGRLQHTAGWVGCEG